MEESSFSHLDKIFDSFITTFDFKSCLYLDVLYHIEEEQIEDVITALNTAKLPKKYHTFKDFLHEKLFKALSLNATDLFLYTENGIYLKRFFQVEQPTNPADRRACGLSPELLSEYRQKFFPEDSYKKRIFELLSCAIDSTLNVRKISPSEFKSLFIPTFVNLSDIVVIENSDLDDLRSIRGLSFHLLREIFEEMMLKISEDILFHFSNQEKRAADFLGHFSIHETIDAKGNRYKPNPILDESNRAWNMTTIRSTMIQHKKSKQALYDKRNDLINIKRKIENFKLELKEISNHFKNEQHHTKLLEEKLDHIHHSLDNIQNTSSKEVKFSENGEEKVYERKQLITQLFKREDMLINEKAKQQKLIKEIELAFANKQKEILVWERRYSDAETALATLESQGHPIDAQYERIQRALAKTLSQR